GAVPADHHRGPADDLLRGRGGPGSAARRPPDAPLALGRGHHLRAARRRRRLAAAGPAQRREPRQASSPPPADRPRRRHRLPPRPL
ncbi:MAG: hypothetical protein AVDCRST_MAG48-2893, partial [uncultured Friedmanniella sp.]